MMMMMMMMMMTMMKMMMMFSRSLLAPLLLLAAVSRALGGGEYCHAWRDAAGARHRGFRCPERYDGESARYCCGSCALRYCCAAPDARLDQSSCTAEFDFYTEGARDIPPNLPTYLPFVIVVSAFLSFVLLGSIISICCCHCVQPKPSERPGPTHTTLLESSGPSPKSSTPSNTPNSGLHPPARPGPSDLSVYAAFPPAFVTPPLHQGAPQFYPNYPNYPLPPEHTMLIAPAFLDAHGHVSPFTPDPVYPTLTV